MSKTPTEPNGSNIEGERTLVPVDGSELSLKAIEHACTEHPEAEITVVHVLESPTSGVYESLTGGSSGDFEDSERQRRIEVEELLEEVTALADEQGISIATETLTGNVANAILTYGEETDTDRIVIGRSGRSSIERTLLGSVTESVSDNAKIPVTIVR